MELEIQLNLSSKFKYYKNFFRLKGQKRLKTKFLNIFGPPQQHYTTTDLPNLADVGDL